MYDKMTEVVRIYLGFTKKYYSYDGRKDFSFK